MRKSLYVIFIKFIVLLMVSCNYDTNETMKSGIEMKIWLDSSDKAGGYTELITVHEPFLGGYYLGMIFNVIIKNQSKITDTIQKWDFIETPRNSAVFRINYFDSINRFCTNNKRTIYPPIILRSNENIEIKMVHCVEVNANVVSEIRRYNENLGHLSLSKSISILKHYLLNHLSQNENNECIVPFAVRLYTTSSDYCFNVIIIFDNLPVH